MLIVKALSGSRLYGLDTPASDYDYIQVVFPPTENIIGLSQDPNSLCKEGNNTTIHSLKRFLNLSLQGQPAALELLFTPKDKIIESSPVWDTIVCNRDLFLSRRSMFPFVGFAKAQIVKYRDKIRKYQSLSELCSYLEQNKPKDFNAPLRSYQIKDQVVLGKQKFTVYDNSYGHPMVDLFGCREYDVGIRIKDFMHSVHSLKETYGARTRQHSNQYDVKSIIHTLRLLGELEQLLIFGKITLPLPEPERSWLREMKLAEKVSEDILAEDYFEYRLRHIQDLKNKCSLPEDPDYTAVEKLCIKLHFDYLDKYCTFR